MDTLKTILREVKDPTEVSSIIERTYPPTSKAYKIAEKFIDAMDAMGAEPTFEAGKSFAKYHEKRMKLEEKMLEGLRRIA